MKAVAETDIFRLRRGLCLPCAAATCINLVTNQRLIGDNDGMIRVGDIYQVALPFHNKENLTSTNGEKINNPWWVVTKEGDMYHHVILAFSLGLGIPAQELTGFDSVKQLQEFLHSGGSVAVSLDNHFVIKQTLKNNPKLVRKDTNGKPQILIEGKTGIEFHPFEDGRHVVSLAPHPQAGYIIVIDSFLLPQQEQNSNIMHLPVDTIDHYLKYWGGEKTRAIAFALQPGLFSTLPPEIIDTRPEQFIPQEVVNQVKQLFAQYC